MGPSGVGVADREALEAVVGTAFGRGLDIVPVKAGRQGHRVYAVGRERRAFVKVDDIAELAVEHAALMAARRAGVPVPEVVSFTELEAGRAALALKALPGHPLSSRPLALVDPRALQELGAVLAVLHDVPASGWGPVDRRRPESFVGIYDCPQQALTFGFEEDLSLLSLAGVLSASQTDAVRAAGLTASALLPNTLDGPRLLHGDLSEAHIFVNSAGDRLTGVIDFGAAEAGPRERDLARLALNTTPDVFRLVVAALEPSESKRVELLGVVRVYELFDAVRALAHCVRHRRPLETRVLRERILAMVACRAE